MLKQNLILLHGALGSEKELAPLKLALSEEFNVFTLDFEGHGERTSNKAFSLDLFAENLLHFTTENKIEQTNVFGYSMGGYVALKASLIKPSLIPSIITLGTKFNWSPEVAEQETKYLNPDKIADKIPKYAAYLESLHGKENWKTNLRKTAELMNRLGNAGGLTNEECSCIKAKVYLGLGAEDKMVTASETKQVQRLIPNASYFSLKDTVHPINKVDVGLLAATIKSILK